MDGLQAPALSAPTLQPLGVQPVVSQLQSSDQVEVLWMLLGSYLLFFGQAGFALLEAGHVRAATAKQVPFKVVLQVCIVSISWWAIGQPLAFGEHGPAPNSFVGGNDFFLRNPDNATDGTPERFSLWMLQMSFACMVVATVSGALAERARLVAHAVYAVVISAWVYPVVVHWVWSTEGWLSARRTSGGPLLGGNGLIDIAGSGVVHVTSGAIALTGAYFIGPRQGRFHSTGQAQPMPGSSMVLAAMGTLFLWFCWYGLAPSNTWLMVDSLYVASRVAVACTLAGAAGGLGAFAVHMALHTHLEMRVVLDGALAGLVAISAAASVVEMYGAVLIGAGGGLAYLGGMWLLAHTRIDDPLNHVAVNLLPGLWGLLAAGLFATPTLLTQSGYPNPPSSAGVFYGGSGLQLGIQVLGAVIIAVWSAGWACALFYGLRHFKLLRVRLADEMIGWYAYAATETGRRHTPGVHPALIPTGRIDSAIADVHLFLDDLETATSPINKDYYMASKGGAQHHQFFGAAHHHPGAGMGSYPPGSYPAGGYPPGGYPQSPGSPAPQLASAAAAALAKQTSKHLSNQLTAAGYPSATSSATATISGGGTSYMRLPNIGAFRAASSGSYQGGGTMTLHCHSMGSANSGGMSPLAEELGTGVCDAASAGSVASGSYPMHPQRSPSRAHVEAMQASQQQAMQASQPQQQQQHQQQQQQQQQRAQSPVLQQSEPQAHQPPQRQSSSVEQQLAGASFKSAASQASSPQASPRTTKEY